MRRSSRRLLILAGLGDALELPPLAYPPLEHPPLTSPPLASPPLSMLLESDDQDAFERGSHAPKETVRELKDVSGVLGPVLRVGRGLDVVMLVDSESGVEISEE